MTTNPFDSIDSAHQYVGLLRETVTEVQGEIQKQSDAVDDRDPRRTKALQLIAYKLSRLEQHLRSSRLILNDLRTLRNLLLKEPDGAVVPMPADLSASPLASPFPDTANTY